MLKRLRAYVRNAANWSVGFVLTGYVFHGLDWDDYREAGLRRILTSLVAFGGVCLGIAYIALVMPTDIQSLIGGILLILLSFRVFIFGVHWLGVEWIERNQ